MPLRKGTFQVKTFPQGEEVVAMTMIETVLVIATNKAVYATGNEAKIKNLFPEEQKGKIGGRP